MSAAISACGADMKGTTPGGSGATAGTSGNGSGATSATGGNGAGGGSGGSQPTGGTGNSSSGGSGNGTSGGTGGGGTGGGGSGGGGGEIACAQGVPTSSQVPRMLNWQYDQVVKELLGVTTLASGDGKKPSQILYPDYNGPMNRDSWDLYQDVASKISSEVMAGANKSKFIACDPAAANCLTDTIKAFGRKAFRHPMSDAEVARFAKLSQTTPAGTPAEVAQTMLQAFLVSPSFLQLNEMTADKMENGAIKLSSYEVATRLSFLLWGSVPDDALNAAADADMLQTKDQILAQATRMLMDHDKVAPLVAAFHRNYADMDNADSHWWKVQHDATKYPLYNAAEEPTFMAELDAFFQDVAFSGGSFKDLFLSPNAFVTKATAPIYGLDASAYGDTLTKVQLDPAVRPGFLTRLGFLQSYAHFDSTSPILRGAFVTVKLIGVNPGAPDPAAFQTPAPPGDYKTERAYVEALTGQAACKGCHIPYVNPPGFVLENYDAIGKWQDTDPRGDAINPVAKVDFGGGNVKDVHNALELATEIGKGTVGRKIYAENLETFTTGRNMNPADACTRDTLTTKLATDGYSVLNLFADLTQADSFRLRVRETP
jgi:hypothetical protein